MNKLMNKLRASFFVVVMLTLAACGGGSDASDASDAHDDTGSSPHEHSPVTSRP